MNSEQKFNLIVTISILVALVLGLSIITMTGYKTNQAFLDRGLMQCRVENGRGDYFWTTPDACKNK